MLRKLLIAFGTPFMAGAFFVLNAEPVRIGVLTDLSGPMASWGSQTRLGAQIAQEKIQARGGDIKLIFGDHQLQGKNAVTEFQKLHDIDGIDTLYVEFTPAAVAIAPIVKSKDLLMIYGAAATSPLKSATLAFKTYMDYIVGCRMIANNWKKRGIRKVGMLKANLEFADLCIEGLKEIYPDYSEQNYNPGTDVDSQLLVFKNRGIEAILNVGFTPDFLRMFKSLEKIRYYPDLGANQDAVGAISRSQFPKVLEKTTVFSMPVPSPDFISEVKDRDPKNNLEAIEGAAMSYLHIQQLYDSMVACKNTDTKKYDSKCAFEYVAKSSEDKGIGFAGWHDRVAVFKLELMTWNKDLREMELLH